MRILSVTPHYYPEVQFGGPPRKIHGLSCGLARRHHNVRVVTFHSAEPRLCVERLIDGIPVQYLPWTGCGTRQIPLSFAKVKDAVVASDIIHVYGLYNVVCPMAARLARRCGRPLIVEPLGMFRPKTRSQLAKRFYNMLVTHRMFSSSAAVIVASEQEKSELADSVDPSKVIVRRNGIDVSAFQTLPGPQEFRETIGLSREEAFVLFLGRISPIKNLEMLVRAFAASTIAGRLVLAGPVLEQHYVTQLRKLISELGLLDRVLLPGPIYEGLKLSALAGADFVVLPSIAESFGNAAAEAVAAGVPVLLTETCGVARLINGRAGLAVPVTEIALADGLRRMRSPERDLLLAQMQSVADELGWEEPLDVTEELYRRVTIKN